MFIKSIFYRVHFLSLGTYERAHVYIVRYYGGNHNLCELSKLYMKNKFKYCLPLAMKMRM